MQGFVFITPSSKCYICISVQNLSSTVLAMDTMPQIIQLFEEMFGLLLILKGAYH